MTEMKNYILIAFINMEFRELGDHGQLFPQQQANSNVEFVLSFFPRGVLDETLNLIESVSEDFPSYSCNLMWNTFSERAFW